MSISKRSMDVEGFKSEDRPALTLKQIQSWFPGKIIEESKTLFNICGLNIKKIRIDEATNRKKFIEDFLNGRV